MDIVGTAASIVTFVNLTAETLRLATKLVQQFRDAPAELQHLTTQLALLQSELIFIGNLEESLSDDNLALLPDETCSLSGALAAAESVIIDVQKACIKYKPDGKPSTYNRLVWAFHDHSKMKDIISRLQQTQMSVQTILMILNVRITSLSRKAIETKSQLAITSKSVLVKSSTTIRNHVKRAADEGRPQGDIVFNSLATRDPHDKNKFWGSRAFLEESWLRLLGLQAVMSRYGNDYQTTYNFSGSLYLQLLGMRLISWDIRIRRFPLAGIGLSFVSGGISVKNVVPEDSQIMTACKNGDTPLVKELFRTGRASPNDVTPENSTPLRYAIENGTRELVEVIIYSGTDVNSPFGQYMTSPLEWAFASRKLHIARLLIENGAKIDHISAKGWTPAFNLFGYEWLHKTEEPCAEYLDLLSAASFSEYDVQDAAGWSVMHRAAVFGNRHDVEALVRHGAPCELRTSLQWTPVRCAVRFGNTDTFIELAKHLPPNFINEQDKCGWTLLHEAAETGSYKMIQTLLQYGADPHIISYPTSLQVPEGLENTAATAAGVAKNESDEAYQVFIQALKDFGLDVSLPQTYGKDECDKDDIFWPAEAG
ncbi:ankyrin repeat-containing domain protein [Bisporella sp. PMI_857]|nr:ankyrin repeat-containing domain protein [Bisporella sp. PMI_857]